MILKNAPTIVCYGELLIDMISTNTGSLKQSKGFLKKFGGAPANVAMGLAKLGAQVKFMGKVGDDPFGHFLKNTLESYHVQTDKLILSTLEKTTLAFVSLDEKGQRDFFFYKGAHEAITAQEVDLPPYTSIFHFGSLTQINNTAYNATDKLLRQAKKMGAIISYDPNVRESLWGNLNLARDVILATIKKVNILKVNEVEAHLITNDPTIEGAAKKLWRDNLDALFITLGAEGCYYKVGPHEGHIPAIDVKTIDTTGAGDAFNAGYIYAIYEAQKPLSKFSEKELSVALKRATTIASLTTMKKGAISAFPTKTQLAQAVSNL